MSTVRNVALFGLPIAAPVIASISSTVYSAGGERLKNADEAMHGDVIGDESRRVLRDDDVLAEPPISELAHCGDDCRVSVVGRDDLEQRQVSGWIEEVGPEPVSAKIAAAPFGEAGNRKPRRVGTDDRSVAAQRVDSLEKRPLRVGPFDDGFDNPVGLSNPLEVRLEASRSDASDGVSARKMGRV